MLLLNIFTFVVVPIIVYFYLMIEISNYNKSKLEKVLMKVGEFEEFKHEDGRVYGHKYNYIKNYEDRKVCATYSNYRGILSGIDFYINDIRIVSGFSLFSLGFDFIHKIPKQIKDDVKMISKELMGKYKDVKAKEKIINQERKLKRKTELEKEKRELIKVYES